MGNPTILKGPWGFVDNDEMQHWIPSQQDSAFEGLIE